MAWKDGRSKLMLSLVVILIMVFALVQYEFSLLQEVGDSFSLFSLVDAKEIQSPMGNWRAQHHFLVGCIALFSAVSLLSTNMVKKVTFFLFQVLGYGIILYADVYADFSALTLFVALSLELHLLVSCRAATFVSCLLELGLLFFPRVDSLWFFVVGHTTLNTYFFTGMYAGFAIIVFHALHQMRQQLGQERSLSTYLKHSVIELSSANVGFQNYAARLKEMSVREERNRIIREVHDSTGYTLTNISMMMEAGQDLIKTNPAKLREVLQTAQGVAQESLQQIRKTLRMLSSDTSSIENHFAVLHRIFTTFDQATNVKVHVEYRNLAMVPPEMINATLFRIIQESLTNAFWHGNASSVAVQFWYEKGLSVVISDNGVGAEHIEEGIGLKSMREQLAEVGGTVAIRTIKGSGFLLDIWIPERSENESTD
ncbi:MAG: sensor histidine kinase [Sphaerochaeta sp.]|nr:sensor histidine kinase [Sphaerochaeta sp.]